MELFSKVRWFQWESSNSSPSTINLSLSTINLHLPNLSVLKLQYIKNITKDWEGWNLFMASKQLKVLKLDGCSNLTCIPYLSAFTQLKILSLFKCRQLGRLHPSIGKLTSLVSLDLRFCRSLKELPGEETEDTGVYECESLIEIPSSIGDLQNLRHLDLHGSAIEELPSAIGRLTNLRTLRLSPIDFLGREFSREIGDSPFFEDLDNDLDVDKKSYLPEIRNLSSLQDLELRGCDKLRSLPELPSSLRRLDLFGCERLRWLPELPSGLTHLSISCLSLRLPQLSSLIHLEELHLKLCHQLEDIPELSSRLLTLYIEDCRGLTLLKLDGYEYFEQLSIARCESIERLDLSRLVRLEELSVEDCSNLVEIHGHDYLESLKDIIISDCFSIERLLFRELRCLKILKATWCINLVEIQGLDGAKFLEELDFTGCTSMKILPNLMGCENLQSLRVRRCEKLTHLRGLEKLNLIYLDIYGCDSLEAIPKLPGSHIYINYGPCLS